MNQLPTAQTSDAETAATSPSPFGQGPRFGLGTTVQADPSQWSVSVRSGPPWPDVLPTAHASSGASATTPFRTPVRGLPRFGVGIGVQAAPSQCTA